MPVVLKETILPLCATIPKPFIGRGKSSYGQLIRGELYEPVKAYPLVPRGCKFAQR
jgi:hypothetical protein